MHATPAGTSTVRIAILAVLASLLATALGAGSAAAAPVPTPVPGNPTCASLGLADHLEYKRDPPKNTPAGGVTSQGNTFTTTFTDGGRSLAWTSTVPVAVVIVKAGDAGANSYVYNPGSTGDSGLQAPPTGNNDTTPAISHVTFCWKVPPPPPGKGSITVVKDAEPADGTLFDFTVKGTGVDEDFQLPDGDSETIPVDPGTYEIDEVIPDGWDLASVTCSDQSQGDLATGTTTVEVSENEPLVCTYDNEAEDGSITVVKQTAPAESGDGATAFGFSVNADEGAAISAFTLKHGQSNPTTVPPGDYDVVETPASGYTLQSISCTDGSPASTSTGKADVNIGPGEDVTCTYVNAKDPVTPPAEQQRVQAASLLQPAVQPEPVRVTAASVRVAGRARLQGPSGCVTRPFSVRIRGREIDSVAFFVGGRRVRTLRASAAQTEQALTYRIDPKALRSGRVSRVTARVTFTTASGTRTRTLRLAVQRCRDAVAPKFTG